MRIFKFEKKKKYDFFSLLLLQGVSIVLLITGIFGIKMWQFTLFGITSATTFELLLYISGLVSSHPFIIYRIIK